MLPHTNNSIVLFSTTKDDDTASNFEDGKPTLEYVTAQMPRSHSSMQHELIIKLAAEKDPKAIVEQLVRNIMAVDRIHYDEAKIVFEQIQKKNHEIQRVSTIPYKIGLASVVVIGTVSIPLVFTESAVMWFNQNFVTMEIPQRSDLDTWLEVGSWSWNWMEPVIGELSFLILCMQLGRSQMANMGMKPYSSMAKHLRAEVDSDIEDGEETDDEEVEDSEDSENEEESTEG